MLTVDAAARFAEALPHRLFELGGYGPHLPPLIVEFLQTVEGGHYARFEHQCFRLLAQGEFGLVVLFEVEVAQFLVYLDIAVKILDVVVVGLPQVFDGTLRHGPHFTPPLLQFAESVECLSHGFAGIDKGLQLFDYFEFCLEVLFAVAFDRCEEFVATPAVLADKLLETGFGRIDRSLESLGIPSPVDPRFARRFDVCAVQLVESHFDGFGVAAQCLYRFGGQQVGKKFHQLRFVLRGKVEFACRSLRRGGVFRGALVVVRLFAQIESGIFGVESGLFV